MLRASDDRILRKIHEPNRNKGETSLGDKLNNIHPSINIIRPMKSSKIS